MSPSRCARLNVLLLTLTILLAPTAAFAIPIFADNFNDGDVSDWVKTTNFAGPSFVTVRADSFVSAPDSMYIYLTPPPSGSDLFVRATHSFSVPIAGNYVLDLWARSSPCSGCTISYDVLVDGSLLTRTFAPNGFESRSLALNGLTPGPHDLTLGMFTTVAFSGTFSASFDDVSISAASATVPEPATCALLLTGLGIWRVQRRRMRT